ncbi:hypothetical protein [Pseudomonas lundensis]|uniref:hypothetical protein n=1 Tax=Pseudomonas lundensis TaxID=86185 RepID=UPI001891069C|nr:hypothetical protein [Pseudomonas lundensis]QOF90710.1 hypothetical protein IF654_17585 [Pseudomonas lundensis]
MFKLEIGVDDGQLTKSAIEMQRRHIPFALVLTATRLAQRIKKGELAVMRKRLDRPTPTTLNSLFLKAATKAKPARVYFKDSWTSGIPADTYLQQAVFGGVRPHKRFEKSLIAQGIMKSGQYALPSKSFLNQYGNVSRGTMTKVLSGLGAAETTSGFKANATNSKRSMAKGNRRYFGGVVGDESGVWERMNTKWGAAVRPVFVFSDGAPAYRTIFPFFKIAENIARAHRTQEFNDALAQTLATARP